MSICNRTLWYPSMRFSPRHMRCADFNFAVAIGTDRKRDLVPIQWFAVIACTYLLIVQDGRIAHTMAIVDTILISTAIVLNRESPWDLFLVFFSAS